jgi:hypothetical protein
MQLIWKLIHIFFSLLQQEKTCSAHEEQLNVLRFQGEDDCANSLRHLRQWS